MARHCKRCGTEVLAETELKEYPFYCPECDENMFEFETYEVQGGEVSA